MGDGRPAVNGSFEEPSTASNLAAGAPAAGVFMPETFSASAFAAHTSAAGAFETGSASAAGAFGASASGAFAAERGGVEEEELQLHTLAFSSQVPVLARPKFSFEGCGTCVAADVAFAATATTGKAVVATGDAAILHKAIGATGTAFGSPLDAGAAGAAGISGSDIEELLHLLALSSHTPVLARSRCSVEGDGAEAFGAAGGVMLGAGTGVAS